MMKHIRRSVGAAALSTISAMGAASAQSLEEIMADALDGSQTLAADRAALDAQREAPKQAFASALPSVSVGGSVSANDATYDPGRDGEQFLRDLGVTSGFNGTGLEAAQTTYGVSLSARQTVYAGGRVMNSIRAARAGVRAAEAGFEAGREDTVFEIASAYFDVVRAEAQRDALQQSFGTLTEQERAVAKSFDLGRASKTDVAAVSAQRADVEGRLATARANVASARLNFQAITGLTLDKFALSEGRPTYPEDIDELLAMAQASNANLQAADAIVEAGAAEVRAARGQRRPAVEIVGSYSYSEGNLIEGDSIESVGVQLQASIPLFSGGRIASEVRQAKADLRSDQLARADLNRRLEAAVRAAYGDAIAAEISRRSAEVQVEARATTLEGVTIEAELGKRTTLDILEAEDDFLTSRFSAIDARIREQLTVYNLLRLTGSLSQAFDL
ncbi:MAG: TolC family protein [Pseudomonadota bacterium]